LKLKIRFQLRPSAQHHPQNAGYCAAKPKIQRNTEHRYNLSYTYADNTQHTAIIEKSASSEVTGCYQNISLMVCLLSSCLPSNSVSPEND
jgi:hypothetical protein